ncbi:hypothetical protein [Streptomyces sp. NPDC101115]|uniref:hypothetical protein n=1 Tax=Streptomyces sp. NPDC101115 TaxID=3366106 RepID=UPI00381BD250
MTAAVLALGVGAVTASGCVWYVPALTDLRAGADRPVSRRLTAAACVTGWATAAIAVLLLLLGVPVRPLTGLAAVGLGACIALRVRAAVRRRREEREDAACWRALVPSAPSVPGVRPQAVFARWTGVGLIAAATTGALLLTWGKGHGVGTPLAVAAPAALAACAVLAAVLRTAPALARRNGPARRP